MIDSERAFLFEARTSDLAPQAHGRAFALAGNLTPGRRSWTAWSTTGSSYRTIDVTFREGLRLEQMTAKLATVEGDLPVDPAEFYELVTKPTDALLGDYPWLLDENVRPKGAALEGFLYPATYTIRVDTGRARRPPRTSSG